MKQYVFQFVRWAHAVVAANDLPQRVGIYFHDLPRQDWAAFEDGISRLIDLGYRCAKLDDYLDEMRADRRFFISFDDNFEDWHDALPLFDRLGVTATFYVNSLPFRDRCSTSDISGFYKRIAYDGTGRTLTTSQLKDLAAAGHDIGCHSHSHFNLAELPRQAWDGEIVASRAILEDLLGRKVDAFSFPYGMARFFSDELRDYCRDAGFRSVASGSPGVLHVEMLDPYDVPRTRWRFNQTVEDNIVDLRIDGRLFTRLTGRSALG